MQFNFAEPLLDWYDRHHRVLPWRVSPNDQANGVVADPYSVWLSEIMLQQTTVKAVGPYFERFIARWPDVISLAGAETEAVMQQWAGLGYYSRARNLIACARQVAKEHDGRFPDTAAELEKLPGIGPYTSAAIAAIAFNESVAVMDGNIERVFSRLFAISTPLPAAKSEIRAQVVKAVPTERPGDFAQALMDLGATICTPRRPACALCPFTGQCAAEKAGTAETYPVKPPKKKKPVRRGAAFVASQPDGAVFLVRRPTKGLLGGMSGVPTTNWTVREDGATGPEAAPFDADWQEMGTITHVFTHFELRLDIFHAVVTLPVEIDGRWSTASDLPGQALPSVMKKAIAAALPNAFE